MEAGRRRRRTYGVNRDQFNRVDFTPVTTRGLRLEVRLQPKFSGGILQWKISGTTKFSGPSGNP